MSHLYKFFKLLPKNILIPLRIIIFLSAGPGDYRKFERVPWLAYINMHTGHATSVKWMGGLERRNGGVWGEGDPAQFAILQGLFTLLPVDMDMSVSALAGAGAYRGGKRGGQIHMGVLSASGGWKSGGGGKAPVCMPGAHFVGQCQGNKTFRKVKLNKFYNIIYAIKTCTPPAAPAPRTTALVWLKYIYPSHPGTCSALLLAQRPLPIFWNRRKHWIVGFN